MLCCCSSYIQKQTPQQTPNFELCRGEGCSFFCSLKLPYLCTTILSLIEALRINKDFVVKSPWNYTVLPGAFEDYSLCQVLHWEETE